MINKTYLECPVLFIIYDRADTTLKVFNSIKRIKPNKLFISSDGPAKRYENEYSNVINLRKEILNLIDWDCEINTFFGEKNLGPRLWIAESINWFFNNVEEGIILEHDCLPDDSFFYYCRELLNKYRHTTQIMHISGANFLFGKCDIKASYYYSKYPFIWGWATWKRAWEKYDLAMADWEKFHRENKFKDILNSKLEEDYWKNVFERVKNGRFNTWDYQWIFSIWKNNSLSINASRNLVSNIGYDEKALNTYNPNSILSQIKPDKIENIVHPAEFKVNKEADRISFEYYFGEHLNNIFDQNEHLQKICDERLELINSLVKTAEERLEIIKNLELEIKKIKNTNY